VLVKASTSGAMRDMLALSPVIPVVTLKDAADAVPLARALLAGGLKVVEVTLRTSAGMEGIRRIAAEVPELVVGSGTVLTAADLDGSAEAGARFAVSPGLTPILLAEAATRDLPYLPGAATASEVMMALEHGFDCLKVFPASSVGTAAIKSLAGPFPQVTFCATGGITPENAGDYLRLPNIAAVGASWVVPDDALAAKDWEEIENRARQAAALSG